MAVPLFGNAALVAPLLDALLESAADFDRIAGRLILINDSPGDPDLAAALERNLPRLRDRIPVSLWTNDSNIGFLRTANRALRFARDNGSDVVLLNSDALPAPGTLAEMRAVAELDPLIGFVSPRSNNATICDSPAPARFRTGDPKLARRLHKAIEELLPRVAYAPTAVGFCLYIKHEILEEFGFFDETFGDGYNEENDLILRANRRGYRAALANHAFAFHVGSASFATTAIAPAERDAANALLLNRRHPHFAASVQEYFAGAERLAEHMLAGLVPDASGRWRVLFDCEHLTPTHTDSCAFGARMLRAFVGKHGGRYQCHVAASDEALRFHGLDGIQGLVHVAPGSADREGPYLAAIRLAQPFDHEVLARLTRSATLSAFVILDTSALDRGHLGQPRLPALWQRMLGCASLLGYASEATRAAFRSRFFVPEEMVEFVAMPSIEADEGPTLAPAGDDPSLFRTTSGMPGPRPAAARKDDSTGASREWEDAATALADAIERGRARVTYPALLTHARNALDVPAFDRSVPRPSDATPLWRPKTFGYRVWRAAPRPIRRQVFRLARTILDYGAPPGTDAG
ncbi:MAG: glycosyltransferase family 2 protein [Rhizobiales bacterium]|nr:glycosyltransferase family 2 protein [Hyphomicrobiales bacterium]MBN9008581.1 glycosyltransferase family 2 protein [Hyphomicrobiales bacterium]